MASVRREAAPAERAAGEPARPSWRLGDVVLAGLCVAALGQAIHFTAGTLRQPILDEHAFRQTQTAIAVRYALREGALIDYQTPVLGAPWSLPQEAPVYQAIVTGAVALTGAAIEPAGRLVSFVFFLGTVWLGGATLRVVVPENRRVALVFAALMLTSPLYLFWSRTVLIETCAVFFGLAWLHLSIRATRDGRPWLALSAVPLGVLAILAKLTTWPAFLAAYGAYWVARSDRRRAGGTRVTAAVAAGVLLAGVAGGAWTLHAAALRAAGPIAKDVTPISYLVGTPAEHLTARLWAGELPGRMLPDILGVSWFVTLLALVGAGTMRRRDAGAAASGLALFLLPLFLFPNVHRAHDYYQVANGLFLIAAVAILVAGVGEHHRWLAALVLLALVAGQCVRFAGTQRPTATRDLEFKKGQPAARFVERYSAPDTSLVVFGMDWSPEIHYSTDRKGLAVPNWVSADVLRTMLRDPEASMGGLPLGAVIVCRPSPLDARPDLQPVIDEFLASVRGRIDAAGGLVKQFARCTAYVLDVRRTDVAGAPAS